MLSLLSQPEPEIEPLTSPLKYCLLTHAYTLLACVLVWNPGTRQGELTVVLGINYC